MSQFHSLKIKAITKETENAVSILFEVPDTLKSKFVFKAGQYITLKTELNNEEIRRDYSICTHPKSEELKVVVKEVPDGKFSKFANQELNVGDILEVSAPNGRFILEPDTSVSRTIVAFAAGSGITPIMGILKTVLFEEPQSDFVLVFGNKTPKDTIFFDEIIALQSQFASRFKFKLVFSQSNEAEALFGRIERSTVNYILNQLDPTQIDSYYLCGPEGMINAVTETLLEKQVAKDKINYELFTSSEAEPIEINGLVDGETHVTVMVDDEESTFTMSQNKTILEEALSHDIDAPYSCQGGICSSCIARLTEGKVEMRQNNILTDSELAEGLILTCQSQPTTASVKVDYDDV